MSNPLLVQGTQIPDFDGDDTANRTFVSNISFNDSSLQVLNGEDANYADARNRTTLFVASIRQAEANSSTQTAIEYCPPFIHQDVYAKDKVGIMYGGSMSIQSNGVMIPSPLVPDRPEITNNIMEYDSDYPGTAGASAQNAIWVWKARKITKTISGSSSTTHYGDYLETKNFDTNNGGDNEQWARTYISKKGTQVEVLTHPNDDKDAGISLELDVTDTVKINKLGTSTPAGDSTSVSNDNGTFSGARLGSFMLLLNLKPDEKRSGSDISKTLPWDIAIRMGDAKDAKTNLEDTSKIQIKMSKGNSSVQVDVYGERTTFNLPAPPVSTATQPSGEQDPNTMAISVVPVLNGIVVSVGNYNGLDKKVSNRMSQFCVSNPNLNVVGLYNRDVNPDYPDNEPDDPDSGSNLFDSGDEVAPSIIIQSNTDPNEDCKQGLIATGDQLSIDLFNVTGKIAYIPLFFHTKCEAILVETIGTDTDATNINGINYYYWPLWCKNGMNAVMTKYATNTLNYTVTDVSSPISSYNRTPQISGNALATATLIGSNPFVAGDDVTISGLASDSGIHTLTNSIGNTIQWEYSDNTSASENVINASAKLVGSRSGTLLQFKFKTKQGARQKYDSDEDDDDVTTRYNAVVGRLNESLYPRYPILIYGAIKVQKEEIDLSAIHNNNTPLFDLGDEWKTCITNVQVTHAIEGTTGNMTIDRYALNQVYGNASDFAIQQIGQVDFDIAMTKSGIDDVGNTTYAFRLGRTNDSATQGTLIKGFAYGFGIDQSSGGAEIKVPLYGINRKLEEMKLYNSPFFDGETIEKTVNFLCGWGNVKPVFSYTNIEEKLSASSVLGQVRHEFKMGTSLWDALQEVADDTANYIVVQPDAKLYIYKINQYGEPEHPDFTPINWNYPSARVLNFSRNPDFSQFYNKLIVMALQNGAAQTSGATDQTNPLDNDKIASDLPLFPIAVGVDLTQQTIPHIPWEKLIVKPLESFWTTTALQKYAKTLAKQSLSIYYTGTTTIPGNLGINLWDKFNNQYWITGISHSFDVASKRLTTDLSLAVLRPTGTISEDSNGNIIITAPTSPIEPYDP